MKSIDNKKKIAVVMSSGHFGFFAHAGFLKAIEDAKITPYCFGGSSSGALVSAFAMSGYSAESIKSIFLKIGKKTFWDPDYIAIIKDLICLRGFKGLLKGEKYLKLLEKYLAKDFESAKIPGIITGLNLELKAKEIFQSGSLSEAVCASGLIPLLFRPMRFSGGVYLDGGVVDKAPIYEVYKKFNPDVIVIHLLQSKKLTKGSKISFNPLKLVEMCSAIGRIEDYKIQKDFVESRGVKVIEVCKDDITRISPSSFANGEKAFFEAYKNSAEILNLAL